MAWARHWHRSTTLPLRHQKNSRFHPLAHVGQAQEAIKSVAGMRLEEGTVSDLWGALCLTAHRRGACYNLQLSSHLNFPSDAPIHQKDPMTFSRTLTIGACLASAMTLMACSSMKTPATADVAVSQAAVDNANRSDAVEFAPVEMQAARDKLARAKQALDAKDYQTATDLAQQAQVDAQLAQAKAGSAKAQATSATLQEDIRVLRLELDRSSAQ